MVYKKWVQKNGVQTWVRSKTEQHRVNRGPPGGARGGEGHTGRFKNGGCIKKCAQFCAHAPKIRGRARACSKMHFPMFQCRSRLWSVQWPGCTLATFEHAVVKSKIGSKMSSKRGAAFCARAHKITLLQVNGNLLRVYYNFLVDKPITLRFIINFLSFYVPTSLRLTIQNSAQLT